MAKQQLKSWPGFTFLIDLFFPKNCVNCQKLGTWLCENCQQTLDYNPNNYCLHCYKKSELGNFCQAAKKNFSLEGIIIAGDYKNQTLENLVKTFKYKSAKGLSEILSDYLIKYINKNPILKNFFQKLNFPNTLIIPVPLHRKRQAVRGFNQSDLIARNLSSCLNFTLDRKNLTRRKNNPPQAKLKGEKRLINLKNNFIWQGKALENQTIIIIDDITTTGTTLNECARALKRAGAGKIWGLVIAKG